MEKDPRHVAYPRPVITEHSYDAYGEQPHLRGWRIANKVEIRQAIEAIFNVKVVKVKQSQREVEAEARSLPGGSHHPREGLWSPGRGRPSRSSLSLQALIAAQGPKARENRHIPAVGPPLLRASPRRVFARRFLEPFRHFSVSGYGRIED
ncbi:MAG: 50S ribosomal protein L23 [Adlercreutzia equolifaciens]